MPPLWSPRDIKRFCRELKAEKERQKEKSHKAAATTVQENSDSESSGLIANHTSSVSNLSDQCAWIMDSGAICHMCRDEKSFISLYQLEDPIDVVLGDGRAVTAVGRGKMVLDVLLPNGETKLCTLHDVLYVPKLSYNLLRVAKVSKRNKIVKFTKSACYVSDKQHKMVAKATRLGSLYQLNYKPHNEQTSFAAKSDTKEDIWHKRFEHLGVGLQKLVREKLVEGFDYDASKDLTFL